MSSSPVVAALGSCARLAACAGAERRPPPFPSPPRAPALASSWVRWSVTSPTRRRGSGWRRIGRDELSVELAGADGEVEEGASRIEGAGGGIALVDVGAWNPRPSIARVSRSTARRSRSTRRSSSARSRGPGRARASGSPWFRAPGCRGTRSRPPGEPWPRIGPTPSSGSATTATWSTPIRAIRRTTTRSGARRAPVPRDQSPTRRSSRFSARWPTTRSGTIATMGTATAIGRTRSGSRWRRSSSATGRTRPTVVEPGLDGIYSHVRIGGAEVFLLDDRFWRDPDSLPDGPAKSVLGRDQRAWLEAALAASDAPLKVIAIGHQVLVDYHEWESYAMFAHERRALLDWIRDRRIEGVVFVDGDRHLSELMRDEREGLYPLYELTASPIANRPFTNRARASQPDPDRRVRRGGQLRHPRSRHHHPPGRLTIRVKDADGNEVVRHEISLDEIRFDESAPGNRCVRTAALQPREDEMPLSTGDPAPRFALPAAPGEVVDVAAQDRRAADRAPFLSARLQLGLHRGDVRGARRLERLDGSWTPTSTGSRSTARSSTAGSVRSWRLPFPLLSDFNHDVGA